MTKPWFRPKRFGYGATPATWQGWAATAGLIVMVIASRLVLLWLLPQGSLRRGLSVAIFLCLLAGFFWLVRSKTEGSFRWRWGKDD